MIHAIRIATLLVLAATLAACGSTSDAPPPPDDATADLAGLWTATGPSVAPSATATLEFGDAVAGEAAFLALDPASGVTTCETRPYARLADGGVLFGGVAFDVVAGADDAVELQLEGTTAWTLTPVDGDPPIDPCAATELDYADRPNVYLRQEATLSDRGGELFFTTGIVSGATQPAVRYDPAGGPSGDGAVTATYDLYGNHVVLAAVDANTLVAVEDAGNGDVLRLVDVSAAPAYPVEVRLESAAGNRVRPRAAVYDAGARELLVVGTEDGSPSTVTDNLLLTLDPDTLARTDERAILPGTYVADLALAGGGDLLALVRDAVVAVDREDPGRALSTTKLEGFDDGFVSGIAVDGTVLRVLVNRSNYAYLYATTEVP